MKKCFLFIVCVMMIGASVAQTTKIVYGDTVNKTDVNGKKQGYWVEPSGSYQIKGYYVNDKKEASWLTYHPNGMLSKIETYTHGVLDGVSVAMDDKGYLISEDSYKMGIQNGLSRKFAAGGRKISEMTYIKGLLDGPKTLYYDNGKIQEESYYVNDLRDTVTTWYGTDGKKIAEYTYLKGLFEGPQTTYYDDGSVMLKENFKNNLPIGESKEFFKGGKIKVQGQYVNGLKEGKWIEYDESGKIVNTVVYKAGEEKKK
jgi:uncharacterized protein